MPHVEPILIDLPDALIGGRVLVRPYQAGDGEALFEAVNASLDHLKEWMPWSSKHTDPSASELVVRRAMANWQLREDLTLSFWERETGRFLGGTGLHRIDWAVRRFEIGYWIRADAEGKGLVTETVRLVAGLAFGPLKANRVIIRCATTNHRSSAIPRRLGFRHEGVLFNDGIRDDGSLYDIDLFSMVPEQWLAMAESNSEG